jgi:hypothetical protein
LDDLGDSRGYSHLKEEALDRIKWRNRFGRGCEPVVWQITDDDDDDDDDEYCRLIWDFIWGSLFFVILVILLFLIYVIKSVSFI